MALLPNSCLRIWDRRLPSDAVVPGVVGKAPVSIHRQRQQQAHVQRRTVGGLQQHWLLNCTASSTDGLTADKHATPGSTADALQQGVLRVVVDNAGVPQAAVAVLARSACFSSSACGVANSVSLTASGSSWSTEVQVPNHAYELQLGYVQADGQIVWEHGPLRTLSAAPLSNSAGPGHVHALDCTGQWTADSPQQTSPKGVLTSLWSAINTVFHNTPVTQDTPIHNHLSPAAAPPNVPPATSTSSVSRAPQQHGESQQYNSKAPLQEPHASEGITHNDSSPASPSPAAPASADAHVHLETHPSHLLKSYLTRSPSPPRTRVLPGVQLQQLLSEDDMSQAAVADQGEAGPGPGQPPSPSPVPGESQFRGWSSETSGPDLQQLVSVTVAVQCSDTSSQLVLCGACGSLGKWSVERGLHLVHCGSGLWAGTFSVPLIDMLSGVQAKLVKDTSIESSTGTGGRPPLGPQGTNHGRHNKGHKPVWEQGENRILKLGTMFSASSSYMASLTWNDTVGPSLATPVTAGSITLHLSATGPPPEVYLPACSRSTSNYIVPTQATPPTPETESAEQVKEQPVKRLSPGAALTAARALSSLDTDAGVAPRIVEVNMVAGTSARVSVSAPSDATLSVSVMPAAEPAAAASTAVPDVNSTAAATGLLPASAEPDGSRDALSGVAGLTVAGATLTSVGVGSKQDLAAGIAAAVAAAASARVPPAAHTLGVMKLVGSCPSLGTWDVEQGLVLSCDAGDGTTVTGDPTWSASLDVPWGAMVSAKLVWVSRPAGGPQGTGSTEESSTAVWEDGYNRQLVAGLPLVAGGSTNSTHSWAWRAAPAAAAPALATASPAASPESSQSMLAPPPASLPTTPVVHLNAAAALTAAHKAASHLGTLAASPAPTARPSRFNNHHVNAPPSGKGPATATVALPSSSMAYWAAENPGLVLCDLVVANKRAAPGQFVAVVGAAPELGSWDPNSALPLKWSYGHRWSAQLAVPQETLQQGLEVALLLGSHLVSEECDRVHPGQDSSRAESTQVQAAGSTSSARVTWEALEDVCRILKVADQGVQAVTFEMAWGRPDSIAISITCRADVVPPVPGAPGDAVDPATPAGQPSAGSAAGASATQAAARVLGSLLPLTATSTTMPQADSRAAAAAAPKQGGTPIQEAAQAGPGWEADWLTGGGEEESDSGADEWTINSSASHSQAESTAIKPVTSKAETLAQDFDPAGSTGCPGVAAVSAAVTAAQVVRASRAAAGSTKPLPAEGPVAAKGAARAKAVDEVLPAPAVQLLRQQQQVHRLLQDRNRRQQGNTPAPSTKAATTAAQALTELGVPEVQGRALKTSTPAPEQTLDAAAVLLGGSVDLNDDAHTPASFDVLPDTPAVGPVREVAVPSKHTGSTSSSRAKQQGTWRSSSSPPLTLNQTTSSSQDVTDAPAPAQTSSPQPWPIGKVPGGRGRGAGLRQALPPANSVEPPNVLQVTVPPQDSSSVVGGVGTEDVPTVSVQPGTAAHPGPTQVVTDAPGNMAAETDGAAEMTMSNVTGAASSKQAAVNVKVEGQAGQAAGVMSITAVGSVTDPSAVTAQPAVAQGPPAAAPSTAQPAVSPSARPAAVSDGAGPQEGSNAGNQGPEPVVALGDAPPSATATADDRPSQQGGTDVAVATQQVSEPLTLKEQLRGVMGDTAGGCLVCGKGSATSDVELLLVDLVVDLDAAVASVMRSGASVAVTSTLDCGGAKTDHSNQEQKGQGQV